MSSPTLLGRLGAILAHARSLITRGETAVPPMRMEETPSAPTPEADAGQVWEPASHDKSFWVAMAGADRRLAELRRAIDQAAAEADAVELVVAAQPTNDADPFVGECRCAKAGRVISEALGAESSDGAVDRVT